MLVLEILTYGFALWLGLYLIARDLASTQLRLAGPGLVAYALALVSHTPATDLTLTRVH